MQQQSAKKKGLVIFIFYMKKLVDLWLWVNKKHVLRTEAQTSHNIIHVFVSLQSKSSFGLSLQICNPLRLLWQLYWFTGLRPWLQQSLHPSWCISGTLIPNIKGGKFPVSQVFLMGWETLEWKVGHGPLKSIVQVS